MVNVWVYEVSQVISANYFHSTHLWVWGMQQSVIFPHGFGAYRDLSYKIMLPPVSASCVQ